jgi:hypothetical protein
MGKSLVARDLLQKERKETKKGEGLAELAAKERTERREARNKGVLGFFAPLSVRITRLREDS